MVKYRVFPAYAGMFPVVTPQATCAGSFPRIRGDVPISYGITYEERQFSPHTRGCSAGVCFAGQEAGVFPAYAGMFPQTRASNRETRRFPRIRGDVPKAKPPT